MILDGLYESGIYKDCDIRAMNILLNDISLRQINNISEEYRNNGMFIVGSLLIFLFHLVF